MGIAAHRLSQHEAISAMRDPNALPASIDVTRRRGYSISGRAIDAGRSAV
jgi:hypothetical protein